MEKLVLRHKQTDDKKCSDVDIKFICVDASYSLVSRRLDEVNSEKLWTEHKLDTSKAEMLAVERPENNNENVVIQTDRRAIAERYKQGRITHTIKTRLWSKIEER